MLDAPLEFNETIVKFYSLTNFTSAIFFPGFKCLSHRSADVTSQMLNKQGDHVSCTQGTVHSETQQRLVGVGHFDTVVPLRT